MGLYYPNPVGANSKTTSMSVTGLEICFYGSSLGRQTTRSSHQETNIR